MQASIACEALRTRSVLALRYNGHDRLVEVHVVGISRDRHEIMRAWQISGGSVSGHVVGWKMILLANATEARVTKQRSRAPRPDYNPEDPAMIRIICQV